MNDKGGVLRRRLDLVFYYERSDPATTVRLDEKLITQDSVNLVRSRQSHRTRGPFGLTSRTSSNDCRWKTPMNKGCGCSPNSTFDRTAGSHALAAAGQRGRSADLGAASREVVE